MKTNSYCPKNRWKFVLRVQLDLKRVKRKKEKKLLKLADNIFLFKHFFQKNMNFKERIICQCWRVNKWETFSHLQVQQFQMRFSYLWHQLCYLISNWHNLVFCIFKFL
jgi:hypothetical protein